MGEKMKLFLIDWIATNEKKERCLLRKQGRKISWLSCLLLLPFFALSQLQVAPVFSDNMVLQRDAIVRVWGKATPGEKVEVHFAGQTKKVVVAKDSSWSVSFPKQKATGKPRIMQVKAGREMRTLKDILVGDVWLLSGQSNMEWPMAREAHWQAEKMEAQQPLIRFANPPPAGRSVYGVAYNDSLNSRLTKERFYDWNGWQVSDSTTLRNMSAVGYYFAKAIIEKEAVPIGLINLSIGGAPLETFISREALANSKRFVNKVMGNWLENPHLPEWTRERGMQNVGNNPGGYKDDLGLNHAYKPGFAFEAGVKPLLPFPIKGVLWYQGESNSLERERVEEYGDLLQLLIDDYRKAWKKPAMPFYWVQLSSIDTANYKSQYWPQFRDNQRKLLAEVKNSGMAVTSDIGFRNDVHPTNKKAVGERLARWALRQVYGHDLVPSGPLPLQAIYKEGKIVLSFHYATTLQTADGKPLRGFSLDGETGVEAAIDNNTVVIISDQKPTH
ncbi:MAG: sialate O-acetylesterase, partial [Chitinophagaceae bacterium]